MSDRLRAWGQSTVVRLVAAAVVLVAATVVVLDATRASATYPLNAVYQSAPGLFPGAAVDVLGVPVGTVTSVTNVDDQVDVGMRVRSGTMIPSGAQASLVAPELLGQPLWNGNTCRAGDRVEWARWQRFAAPAPRYDRVVQALGRYSSRLLPVQIVGGPHEAGRRGAGQAS